MKNSLTPLLLILPACLTAACATGGAGNAQATDAPSDAVSGPSDLGSFSVSLAVKDIAASRAFYETLGFEASMGAPAENWLIMRNGDHVIGLFQGLFERNMLTFNPGWDQSTNGLDSFTDVREIQTKLEAAGLTLTMRADESTTGPASLMLMDPDGNPILIDQHVPAPGN